MKKDKKNLFLVVFFAVLFFSHLALAGGPNSCCKLDHKLTEIDSACEKGNIVAPTSSTSTWCDTNDNGIHDVVEVLPNFEVTKKWGECCIVDSIYNITDWLFYILMAGVAIFYIAGAIYFLQASGDPNKVKQAQSFIFYGSIGLLLALMARIIPAILKAIVS